MTRLKKLCISNLGGVNQQGIQGLDLIKLHAGDNTKIEDISFMSNLKKLNIADSCGIDQQGIEGLDLIELDTRFNEKSRMFHL